MKQTNNHLLAQTCLKYFGKMTASATHELKNTLAIVNENAGLLNDLVSFSETRDTPLSNDRVRRLSATLSKQVIRSDEILKKLNRFSHTVDKDIQRIDLGETIKFTIAVSSRLLDMHGVSLTLNLKKTPIMIETHLFYLETLLWQAIEAACRFSGDFKKIDVEVVNTPAPAIWFLFGRSMATTGDFFSSKTDILLLKQLGVKPQLDSDKYRFGLVWPNKH